MSRKISETVESNPDSVYVTLEKKVDNSGEFQLDDDVIESLMKPNDKKCSWKSEVEMENGTTEPNETLSNKNKCKKTIKGRSKSDFIVNKALTVTVDNVKEKLEPEKPSLEALPFPLNLKFSLKLNPNRRMGRRLSYKENLRRFFISTNFLFKRNIGPTLRVLLLILFTVFIIYASVVNFFHSLPLLITYLIWVSWIIYSILKYFLRDRLPKMEGVRIKKNLKKYRLYAYCALVICFLVMFSLFIVFDMKKSRLHFISMLGYFCIVGVMVLLSKNITKINLRTVLSALIFHLVICYINLKAGIFTNFMEFMSQKMVDIVSYSSYARGKVFDNNVTRGMLAFYIFPPLIFFSSLINLLYYVGLMGFVIGKGSLFLRHILNITNHEAVNTFGNIFLGAIEAPLLIRPYLPYLTKPELALVMAGGFSSIAGGVLAVFFEMGVDGIHLLNCCLMSPPATVLLSKIIYPDKNIELVKPDSWELLKSKEENFIHAIAEGAMCAIRIFSYILANLLAFYAFSKMCDAFLIYCGLLVGWNNWTLDNIFGILFYPLSFLMGIEQKDRKQVSKLLGTKVFFNEVIAIEDLIALSKPEHASAISNRTKIITTYALSSFANLGTLGFTIGGMSSLIPHRAKEISKIIPISFFIGFFVSILNAAAAGTYNVLTHQILLLTIGFIIDEV